MPFRLQWRITRAEIKIDLWSAGQLVCARKTQLLWDFGLEYAILPLSFSHLERHHNGRRRKTNVEIHYSWTIAVSLRDFGSRKRRNFLHLCMLECSVGLHFLLLLTAFEAKWRVKKWTKAWIMWEPTLVNAFRGENLCLGKMCECAQVHLSALLSTFIRRFSLACCIQASCEHPRAKTKSLAVQACLSSPSLLGFIYLPQPHTTRSRSPQSC